ncbi:MULTISPECIES: helix-turn-helix domain-containing protein [Chromobacterium]|uniref:Helix-turn-helix domain-containing protein n=1 Tax=Chromobacterium haemolyticum TaxID=394935 RepID=A0ABS3GJE0_9NEIS|nr:helix-turn-helix domain-containing protein [Chromobacterium haemolyticum]MBK0413595.1 helix-turn-helix domain-containing protein [Chromobacterium haemolyticum]MBO0414697.1 helix-turn-helix domain-containing protein [Chromobacterium haemolyticum]MBO0497957.1 helix-turn-helix domain-containing protein [Chromobacterium haemolyticum]UGA40710.1 helix-turn-helix domain-containing protein [Chromobacterium haemolyticum]
MQKKAADWHRADIVAAVHKAGWSLRRLSIEAGLCAGALNNALDRSWPKAEGIIAAAIGVPPESIWPSRYNKRHFKPVFPAALPKSTEDCASTSPVSS